MDGNNDLPHNDEQFIDHDISNLTLEIGDQVGRVASEDRDEVSQSDTVEHSVPTTSTTTYDLACALQRLFQQLGRHENLEMAILLHREALELRPGSHTDRPSSLNSLASALHTRYGQSGRREDLEEVILFYRQALELLSASHPERSKSLNNVASALLSRFTESGRHEDLEEAILLNRRALELRPASHPEKSLSLNNLANALQTRFEQLGRIDDLEEAVLLHREALELRPASHPLRSTSFNNLANALHERSNQSGRHEDLEEAILLHREALKLRPVSCSDRSVSLANLANALHDRFKQSGRHEDLEEAILSQRQALGLRPVSHPLRSVSLVNLAANLSTRFRQSGRREDVEEIILLHREALGMLPASHPHQSVPLGNLASALRARFERSGRPEDLEEAISFGRQAVELTPAPHPDRSMTLGNLANGLRIRYEHSSQREDLEEAILLHRQALELRPPSHPNRSTSFNNLATDLSLRYEDSGRHEDLEEAIFFYRKALELRSPSHPERAISFNNLANALSSRFKQSGRREDLKEVILLQRQAVELTPAPHPDRFVYLGNLGDALRKEFKQSGLHEDLEEAILLHQKALELQPASHLKQPTLFNNLANALQTRFEQSGRREDLEETVLLHRQALEALPASHPDQYMFLNNLANALSARFKQSGQRKDLDEAIEVSYQTLNALDSGHPSICTFSRNQGNIFFVAYTHTNESKFLHKAMDSFRVAVTCETAPASERFHTAKQWATLADFRHNSALDAYQAAIQLLPRLAMLGLDLTSRQEALISRSEGLAADAAACAIRSGQYGKAVELLEEGRAVFWSQALQLRTPMTDLRDVAPELISLTLEQGSLRDVSRIHSDESRRVISIEQEASHFHRLNDEWLKALDEMRQLKGFQDFLCPSRISSLLGAAEKSLVVILNASHTGCAALILTSIGVQHVPLPDITFSHVVGLVELIQTATTPESRDGSLPDSNQARIEDLISQMPDLSNTVQLLKETLERGGMTQVSQSEVNFRYVLAVLWESVVQSVIHQLGLEKSDVPPNLRWCPTGPFTFLPIHAAGVYDTKEPECVSDYVVSSYTPTINALLRDKPLPSSPFKMVVVIQPELPYTVDELRRIEARMPVTNAQVPVTKLVSLVSRTVKEVTSHLSTASIVHSACHGRQNKTDPLESALFVRDRPLTVQQIMQQPSSNAMLAFLVACQTATGDKTLPDEAIHLGSTFLFAGFSGVVATMWNISDVGGPGVADTFYEYLFKETDSDTDEPFNPDTTRAARALHLAVTNFAPTKMFPLNAGFRLFIWVGDGWKDFQCRTRSQP